MQIPISPRAIRQLEPLTKSLMNHESIKRHFTLRIPSEIVALKNQNIFLPCNSYRYITQEQSSGFSTPTRKQMNAATKTEKPHQSPSPRIESSLEKRKIFLLTHTHWDREWYLTFEQFRVRLVEILDDVLERLETEPSFRHFHADSQTILFKDYLEVRPGQRHQLCKALAEGRISAGPFYVLNDEFLCSGEAWVENLLFGTEDCKTLGTDPSRVCYAVDNFGHISQVPQICREFGILYFYGIRGWPFLDIKSSEFFVEGPDGSRLLALCHPWTYGLARDLKGDKKQIVEQLQAAIKKLETLAHPSAPLLLMNGIDHSAVAPNLWEITEAMQELNPDACQVSLDEFFEGLEKDLPEKLEVKKLDCRFVPGLYDVLSSRMPQKLVYEEARKWLEDRMDPLLALSVALGRSIPLDHRKHLWRKFLENLPHDSICGCSMDEVHRDIQRRLESVIEGCSTLFERALDRLTGGTETPSSPGADSSLFLFNPLPVDFEGVLEADLDFPEDHRVFHWQLEDEGGKTIPFQLLKTERIVKRLPSELNVPPRRAMLRARVALEASVPPSGIQKIRVKASCGDDNFYSAIYGTESYDSVFTSDRAHRISPCHGVLENKHLHCEIAADGTWTILHKASGRKLDGQNLFEHAPDLGDLYKRGRTPSDPRTLSIGALRRVTLETNGPLVATYALEFVIHVPAGVKDDYSGMREETVPLRIVSRATLRKDSVALEFATTIENNAKDHEIRVLFPAGSREALPFADSIFDVIKRDHAPESFVLRHPYLQTYASSRAHNKEFVDLSDGTFGSAILVAGLQEHEILTGTQVGVAFTLLRATGWIYRESMGETRCPEGQCLGTMTARYAILPHEGDWKKAGIAREARHFTAGIHSRHLYGTCDSALESNGLISIEGPLAFSTWKPAHDGAGTILRIYNPTADTVQGKIRFPSTRPEKILNCGMSEKEKKTVDCTDSFATIKLPPYDILTLRLLWNKSI